MQAQPLSDSCEPGTQMLALHLVSHDWLCLCVSCAAQFAVQIAVCFAKVARQDYPKLWPSLFEDLTGHMQNGGCLASRRVYLILHHVLKELATKRLATDQKKFAQVHCLQVGCKELDGSCIVR